MNQWEVIRYVHKIGSPMNGKVIGFEEYAVLLETEPGYKSRLCLDSIVNMATNLKRDSKPSKSFRLG